MEGTSEVFIVVKRAPQLWPLLSFLSPQPICHILAHQRRTLSPSTTTVSCLSSARNGHRFDDLSPDQQFVFRTSPYRHYRHTPRILSPSSSVSKRSSSESHSARSKSTQSTRSSAANAQLSFDSHASLIRALKQLDDEPVLSAGGGKLVTYRGSPTAQLMVLGDFPSDDDEAMGTAFAGTAGKLLDRIFSHAGLDPETEVYITNIVKRRPPEGRNPTRREVKFFMRFVHEEIRLIQPAIVILAGAFATKAFLGSQITMRAVRGKWFQRTIGEDDIKKWIIPIFHPAYLLRKQSMKKEMMDDMDAIREKYVANVLLRD